MTLYTAVFLVLSLALLSPSRAIAEEEPDPVAESEETQPERQRRARRFGGPDQVDNQIAHDEASTSRIVTERLFDPYFQWKKKLREKRGISLSVDYSAAYLSASYSPGEDSAGGGIARFYGSWDLVGRESGNTGAFVWKVEHRHAYTDVAALHPCGLCR